MPSFDENGKYIKTNWKAGDKITATKLNKIEESIEAVNENDISRHVEADARLDALEAKDVAHDKELTNIKNTIADNKTAAELGDYEINSRMQFLEQELNEGIAEVHNVADIVDEKITQVEANTTAQLNQGKADMEAMVAEVEANVTAQLNQGKADMEAMVAEVEANTTAQLNQNKADVEAMVAEVETDLEVVSTQLAHKANEEEVFKKWSVSSVSAFKQFNHDYVYGLENLYHLHVKVGNREDCKVIFSGDSTTYGHGLIKPSFYAPNNIFKYTCLKEGLFCVNTLNYGQSGKCTEHWNRTCVQDEMAENPDCIVLRWGLNEPSYDNSLNLLPEDGSNYDIRRNANDFKVSLESGLQKLRNWKDMSELTIILMTPNATSTDLSFRNESWHENINPIIRDLARKYKCVFIDVYRYLQDVRNVPFMDIVGDGHIHPLDMMNIWINDLLFDTCFKRTFIHQYTEFGMWKDLQLENYWGGSAQFKWVDYNTVELRGLISGGNTNPLTRIAIIPYDDRVSILSIKTVSTEKGFGCLNVERNRIQVGNFYDISSTNWVSLDGVRIYFE